MSELARMVRRHRVEQQLTQRQAADLAGLSLTTWQSLEREAVDPHSFRDLTLAGAAAALGVPLTTVYRWAQQPLPDVARPTRHTGPVTDLDEQVDQLGQLLHRLAGVSEASFLVAYGQSVEITDHLIRLHEGRAGPSTDGAVSGGDPG